MDLSTIKEKAKTIPVDVFARELTDIVFSSDIGEAACSGYSASESLLSLILFANETDFKVINKTVLALMGYSVEELLLAAEKSEVKNENIA